MIVKKEYRQEEPEASRRSSIDHGGSKRTGADFRKISRQYIVMGGMMTESETTAKSIPVENDKSESVPVVESDPAHTKTTHRVDHRPNNGPLLQLLWSEEEPLMGQTLYLGGEFGVDGKIYCIPGHGKSDLAGTFFLKRRV